MAWPAWAVVNSREHHLRFGGPPEMARLLRQRPRVDPDVLSFSAAPLAEAALSGVLAFGTAIGDAYYELAAQTAAETGQSSFVLAGPEIIYGLNLPLDRVALHDDVAQRLSYDELRQLCGRAGRTGRAARAEVVFLSESAARAALRRPPGHRPLGPVFGAAATAKKDGG